jgi:flavin-dependent dehydrogenase
MIMNTPLDGLPVVVIGAGPVGPAAAAHRTERGRAFLVLEADVRLGLPKTGACSALTLANVAGGGGDVRR